MANRKTAYVEGRSQPSIGSSGGGFGGPDCYFAVQVVPEGVAPLVALNRRAAQLRGIRIIYCGEGYSNRRKSPESMYNVARAKAERIAKRINRRKSR